MRLCITAIIPILISWLTCTPAWAISDEQKALNFEQQSQWTQARRAWQHELQKHPKNLDARYHLAQLLEQAKHPDDAQALYEKNIRIGRHLKSVIALSQRYIKDNQSELAINILKDATKNFRYEAVPWYLLADIAIQQKQAKQAEHYFKKALKADPLNAFAYLHYARFLSSKGQHQQAMTYSKKALRLQKECAPCWRVYGDIAFAAKQHYIALQAYQHSLAIHPSSHTRQHLIKVLLQIGDFQRAKRMQQALNAWKRNHP